MELKYDKRNELIKRRELVFDFEGKGISFDEARKKVADKVNKEEDLIDVYKIMGKFGRHKFEILADVYDSKNDLEIIKKMRMSKKQKEKIEEANKNVKEESTKNS
ncbi:MAG: hypothetical protein AABW83_01305 [Nanoarchaeota archaeon]